ncbi:hypothetical protein JTB14_023399 [Gonioctena quinquepunctata]|nr:hypothetical protein JTB14_023399 [Gonioctena quinquepunctata]
MQVDNAVEEVAEKWRSLRDFYMKMRGEMKKKPRSGFGQRDTTGSEKIWKFYDLMPFLDDTLEFRQTTSNIEHSTHRSESSSSSISSDNCNLSKASFNSKKRKRMESSVLD